MTLYKNTRCSYWTTTTKWSTSCCNTHQNQIVFLFIIGHLQHTFISFCVLTLVR